jgi:uncharacterized protein (TIGR02757 family)
MASEPARTRRLKRKLEDLYLRYNRRDLVDTDPLGFIYGYDAPEDREVVGLLASALAYGKVVLIRRSIERVLRPMVSPAQFLRTASTETLKRTYRGFRHRFTGERELTALLAGIKKATKQYGSLKNCFLEGLRPEHETVQPALEHFTRALGGERNPAAFLLPAPAGGSACKRLNLFLRWMVRHDAVDPGGWEEAGAHRLIIPLDTHLFRTCRALGFTRRKQADMRAALEITEAFRRLSPEDPMKYDFAISRLGILRKAELGELIRTFGVKEKAE